MVEFGTRDDWCCQKHLGLAVCHDSKVGGHSGVLKNLKRVQWSYYWEGIAKMVQQYVADVRFAKLTNTQKFHQRVCYNRYQFLHAFGKMSH